MQNRIMLFSVQAHFGLVSFATGAEKVFALVEESNIMVFESNTWSEHYSQRPSAVACLGRAHFSPF